tara:strand:+ start:179 stop:526 length:348 start_codon:yes stop_codon:yes gene_type:complete
MAIPSGSGTEVLKVSPVTITTNSATNLITGVANHIYTVLSVSICETGGVSEALDLYLHDDGSTIYYLMRNYTLPAYTSFVYNDKFVLSGTDRLTLQFGSSCDVDIVVSYIDQDWT